MANTIQFSNVFIASDILSTSMKEQDSNLRWLQDLFSRPLSNGSGVAVAVASRRWNDAFGFERERFFELSGMAVDLEETQIFFEASKVADASIDYFRQHFPPGSVIFGYELSAATREVIDRSGLTYIDMWLHPIRFLDDLLFAFNSNDHEFKERMSSFELPEELSYVYAGRLRVQMYRGKPRISNDLKPHSALYVGQTLKDKAIASDRGMLSLLNFCPEFDAAAQRYHHIYYSRHPFVKNGDEKTLSYARGFKNVSLTENPTYMLLASDEIEFVFTISSSVVTEAKYFGKETQYLFKPPVRIYSDDGYCSLLHNYLFSDFWRYVFSGGERPDARSINFIDGRNKVRDMLNWYWGFRQIDRLEGLYNNVSSLLARKG
ncbi:hypothetical protein [Sinorhizobium sp. BG8]|uniref:hypothetical protein n=1 Tax=Sinorhizobium sp. BG8 TaxID=2613773 RepID=UPI00193EA0D5|nr:hypothetical protein [Sinorhizobium sp. BG8]QRM55160.1 hypothetical protein F3Y30_11900 [Sinorhizobium sp. BG8]